MLHSLIFTKLLGEIDYGAMGDFTPAGCVLCSARCCRAASWRGDGLTLLPC